MNKNEIVLTELLNCNAISEQAGLTAKDMSEIVGFNAAAKLSELKARTLVSTTTKGILNVYWLTKAGIEKANSILTGAAEPDPEEATVIDQVVADNVEAFNALTDVAGFSMPTTGTNYETDLNRENASLRQVIANLRQQKDKLLAAYDSVQEEAQKHATTSTEIHKMLTAYGLPENGLIARVKSLIESHKAITDDLNNALEACRTQSVLTKNLEQNARELNARIAALESHQGLISEEGLLEQIADLELKLASLKSADTFYTVNTGTTVLTFNDEEKAIESAHNEAQLNNEQATVEKIYRVKFGVAKPVKSTVWEVF